jgi:hypothetical protein
MPIKQQDEQQSEYSKTKFKLFNNNNNNKHFTCLEIVVISAPAYDNPEAIAFCAPSSVSNCTNTFGFSQAVSELKTKPNQKTKYHALPIL